ncbi:hypothetical protein A8924_3421 [Saccharopolyspora erythraea NRRL 2338]|nr:hypothetical protein [Saccharopolyspora erythraea]PFG96033.1 hypothetical protein A8924_3421 [Saccharopolyspora erythraea NRRL 2338]
MSTCDEDGYVPPLAHSHRVPDAAACSSRPGVLLAAFPVPQGTAGAGVSASAPGGTPLLGSTTRHTGTGVEADITLWDGDRVNTIDIPGSGTAADMNAAGVVVGTKEDAENDIVSWVLDSAGFHLVPGKGQANAINSEGRIVGYPDGPTGSGPPVQVPVTWPSASAEPVDLPRPGDRVGEARDIADDGTIVGAVGPDAVLWRPDGTAHVLPRPADVPPEVELEAVRVNGPWVVGGGYGRPLLSNLDTGAVGPVPGLHTATDVNAAGWVVDQRGALVAGGSVVELPGFGDDHARYPRTVSADGRTIGGMAQFRGNPSPAPNAPCDRSAPEHRGLMPMNAG